jgi:hypothetical protein
MDATALNERMAELCGVTIAVCCDRHTYIVDPNDRTGGDWNPAEDIQQCFDYVVVAMRGKRWHLVLMQYSESWSAVFTPPSECIGSGRFANDESPARAICEAALKAMG